MKDLFVNSSINLLISKYKYDEDTLDRVKYGLELIYITITKLTVILLVSLIFGLIKESIIFSLFITGLRTFAYGLHAKKSWHCYISSLFSFVLMPYVFINININVISKIIISVLCLTSMIIYAPADTHKRPIINKNQRNKLKIIATTMCAIYIVIIFISNNIWLNNLIILSMITESFVINPFIYKVFDLPYDNYKTYLK